MATRTWTGDGTDNNWTTAANWGGTAPVAGDDLRFAGSTRTSPVNNFTADTTFASITFNSDAAAFTTSGNRITLTNGITNASGNIQRVNHDIIVGSGTHNVTHTGSGDTYIGGVISGTGSMTFAGSTRNTKILSACTYTGDTVVSTGHVLSLGLQSGADGSITSTGSITLAGSTMTIAGSGTHDYSMVISGTGAVNINGLTDTIITFSGNNTYSGKTSILYGTLIVSSLNKVSGGSASSSLGHPTTAANGTIALGTSTGGRGVLKYTGSGETTDRVINLSSTTAAQKVESTGSGTLKFTSACTATGAGSKTLTIHCDTGTIEFSGAIVDNSSTNKTSIDKTGSGVCVLSGTNTYTGATTVNGGILSITGTLNASSAVTINNGGTLEGTGTVNGAITVKSGGTLAPGIAAGTVIGTLNTAAVTFESGGIFALDADGTTPSSDSISGTTIDLGTDAAVLSVTIANSSLGDAYTVINASVSLTGTPSNANPFTAGGRSLQWAVDASSLTLTDVPGGPPVGSLMMPFFTVTL